MMRDAWHIARKDLHQLRAWVAAFVAVVVVRAALVGSGVDAPTWSEGLLPSFGVVYTVLCVMHVALLVTIAVQVVQADRLVGTTAFWVTRPIARGSLLGAKLATAGAVLVALPAVADAAVVLGHGLAWSEAAGAFVEAVAIRLAIVAPVMAIASFTADLAVFVVATIASLVLVLAGQIALQALGWGALPRPGLGPSIAVVVVALICAGSLAALAHQAFTRRTARSAAIAIGAAVLMLMASNSIQQPFVGRPRSLEPGWLDPARVTATVTTGEPFRAAAPLFAARPWTIHGTVSVGATTGNVFLGPIAVASTAPSPGETTIGVPRLPKHDLERLVGGVTAVDLPDDVDRPEWFRAAQLTEDELRALAAHPLAFRVTLSARVAEPCAPLWPGARTSTACGNRQVRLLGALCEEGRCRVTVRDVAAGFAVDRRRWSSVTYVLVNRRQRLAIFNGERPGGSDSPTLLPAMFGLLGEHIAIVHRHLLFELPRSVTGTIDASWQSDAVIVPLQIRNVGEFTVPAKVAS